MNNKLYNSQLFYSVWGNSPVIVVLSIQYKPLKGESHIHSRTFLEVFGVRHQLLMLRCMHTLRSLEYGHNSQRLMWTLYYLNWPRWSWCVQATNINLLSSFWKSAGGEQESLRISSFISVQNTWKETQIFLMKMALHVNPKNDEKADGKMTLCF